MRIIGASICALIVVAAGGTVYACGDGDSESTTAEAGAERQEVGGREIEGQPTAKVTDCPDGLSSAGKRSCEFAQNRLPMEACPKSPAGANLKVSGLDCAAASELIVALGASGATSMGNYKHAVENIYQPAVIDREAGTTEPTGWTCWDHFRRGSPDGIQFVCWNGDQVMTFNFY